MAINYLVRSRKLTTAEGKQEFFFAQSIGNGVTSMEHLQKLIARISALSEGDVRSVIMNLSSLIADELSAGRIVELGDLGRMRIGLRSKGSKKEEDFKLQSIKKLKVLFHPGSLIRDRLSTAPLIRFEAKGLKDGTCKLPEKGGKKDPKKEKNDQTGKSSSGL